jgi:UDP-arabinose 4-epimerase
LQVFGTDYPTPDGTCIRDYIHVADLARAHVLALDALRAGQDTMALNLGTGQGRSIREVLTAIKAVTGRDVPVVWGARRPGDPPALVADPTVARERLGFIAEKSDLSTILTDAAPWFRADDAV